MNDTTGNELQNIIFTHDDSLIFIGQKHEIGLDENWKRIIPKIGKVYQYYRQSQTGELDKQGNVKNEYLSVKEYEKLEFMEKYGWIECTARDMKLDKDVTIHAQDSYVEVRMNNLWDNFQTRYRAGLETLVKATDKNILSYNKRETGTEAIRQRTEQEKQIEAIRRRFRTHWHASKYEHNLLLPRDIGLVLLDEIRDRDQAKGKYKETVYIKGYGETNKSILVKVYDMKEKHGIDNIKIEVTLRQDYMKRNNLKDPNEWGTQPEIQERILLTLKREWRNILGNGRACKMLKERTDTTQAEIFNFMGETRNTLTEVKERLARVEKQTAENTKQIELLKKQ